MEYRFNQVTGKIFSDHDFFAWYGETCGAEEKYIRYLWETLMPITVGDPSQIEEMEKKLCYLYNIIPLKHYELDFLSEPTDWSLMGEDSI